MFGCIGFAFFLLVLFKVDFLKHGCSWLWKVGFGHSQLSYPLTLCSWLSRYSGSSSFLPSAQILLKSSDRWHCEVLQKQIYSILCWSGTIFSVSLFGVCAAYFPVINRVKRATFPSTMMSQCPPAMWVEHYNFWQLGGCLFPMISSPTRYGVKTCTRLHVQTRTRTQVHTLHNVVLTLVIPISWTGTGRRTKSFSLDKGRLKPHFAWSWTVARRRKDSFSMHEARNARSRSHCYSVETFPRP